jgi:hypothetical protein
MLEQDLRFGKLGRFTKSEEESKDLKDTIMTHYLQLKNIFLQIASNSNYPTIGLNDYT